MTSPLHVIPAPTADVPAGSASSDPNRQARRVAYVRTTAETAECTGPDFCERDHGNE